MPAVELARGLAEDRPFGDSTYIQDTLQAAFCRRLGEIARALPVAGDLAEALVDADADTRYRILGDPVVRFTIQQLLSQLRTSSLEGLPAADSHAVLETALECALHHQVGRPGPLVAEAGSCHRLGTNPFLGWIWDGASAEQGPMCRVFDQLIARSRHVLRAPDPAQVETLRTAAHLVELISPTLAANSLGHTQLVALFESKERDIGVMASSQFDVLGTIFMSADVLDNPWVAAESLLHESLHQKKSDIRHAHSVFLADFDSDIPNPTEGVVSLWNRLDARRSNWWGPTRAFAALHVYTHLAVFAALAESARQDSSLPDGWDDPKVTSAETARLRALYLCTEMSRDHLHVLGPAGVALVDWLRQCLELMAPTPVESEMRATLLLQRYRRDSVVLQRAINRGDEGDPATASCVLPLVDREVAATRRILARCSGMHLANFEHELAPHLSEAGEVTTIDSVSAVRDIVLTALNFVLAEGAPDDAHCEAYQDLERMVEGSSVELIDVLEALSLTPSTN